MCIYSRILPWGDCRVSIDVTPAEELGSEVTALGERTALSAVCLSLPAGLEVPVNTLAWMCWNE